MNKLLSINSIILPFFLLAACSSGGGDGNSKDNRKVATGFNLNGEWTLRAVSLESSCDSASINKVSYLEVVDISLVGDQVTIMFENGVETQATISNRVFTDISLATYPVEGGTVTETGMQLTVEIPGDVIAGSVDWTWESTTDFCSGKFGWTFNKADSTTELEGSWQSDCGSLNLGFPASADFTETYDGRLYSYTLNGYENDTCMGTPVVVTRNEGYFYIGNQVPTDSGSTATEVELNIVTASQEGQAGTIADNLTGFSPGEDFFDIYYLDGNSLYYGDWAAVNDPLADRPTDIYFDRFMTRIQ